jgi:hypothetical protein
MEPIIKCCKPGCGAKTPQSQAMLTPGAANFYYFNCPHCHEQTTLKNLGSREGPLQLVPLGSAWPPAALLPFRQFFCFPPSFDVCSSEAR